MQKLLRKHTVYDWKNRGNFDFCVRNTLRKVSLCTYLLAGLCIVVCSLYSELGTTNHRPSEVFLFPTLQYWNDNALLQLLFILTEDDTTK